MKNYKTEMRAITDLTEYENNPRLNEETVSQVAKSIQEVGWTSPIVVDEDYIILAGHTRLKAAKHLSLEKVPVFVALTPEGKPLSEEAKRAYRILDNKATESSGWDERKLMEEFQALGLADYDLSITGFSVKEIEELTEGLMKFNEPPLNISTEPYVPLDLPESQIKMVQLFLSDENETKFREDCAMIQDYYDCDNLTEAVLKAVEISTRIMAKAENAR